MKKNGSWMIFFLIISVAVFGMYLCYETFIRDTTPPVITCEKDKLVVSVEAKEKDLLKGVTATDKKSGDVTGSLVVEQISALAGDERIITYAAIDKKGNVGRAQRVLKYTDYEPPEIYLTESLIFPIGSSVDPLEYVSAQSGLDGDLTDKVKYTSLFGINTERAGLYKVEFRVNDSAGTVSYLPATIEIYNPY